MIRVKVIERRLPHGWETLLEVNGVIGRAEEMLCLEEAPASKLMRPKLWFNVTTPGQFRNDWLRERFIRATDQTVESAIFEER